MSPVRASQLPGRLVSAGALAWVLVLSPACLPDDKPEATLPPAPTFSAVPVDSTKFGEIAEGDERAFGFPLPRAMRVKAKMDDAWYVVGRLRMEHVANYVRDRVHCTKVDTGPTRTVFRDATIKGDPNHRVEIEVSVSRAGTQLVIRDRTRKPVEEGLSERERWERAGMTPDGKVIKDKAE